MLLDSVVGEISNPVAITILAGFGLLTSPARRSHFGGPVQSGVVDAGMGERGSGIIERRSGRTYSDIFPWIDSSLRCNREGNCLSARTSMTS